MVFIRESTDFVVFPPINHENLYIDKDRESPSESSSPSSSSSLSPSDSDKQFEFDRKTQPSISHLRVLSRWKSLYYSILEIDIVQYWWKLLLVRVLSKFQNLVTCFSSRCSSLCSFSRTLRSFYPILVIVIWWWMRNRARRRLRKGEITAQLRDIIKDRDERIAQLLPQIAQMNELLVKQTHSN